MTPSTTQQIITPSRDEYDGLSQVTVEATPLETRTVNPSTSSQVLTPSGSNIGFSTITVNPYRLQSKSVTPSTSSQTVSPDSGYNGLSSVSVGAVSLQSKTVSPSTSSQTVKPSSGYTGLSQVTVNGAVLQNKTVTPSSSTQYISADSGYYGLGTVTVNASDPISILTGTFIGTGTFNPAVLDVSSQIGSFTSINVLSCAARCMTMTTQQSLILFFGDTYGGICYTVDSTGTISPNTGNAGYRVNGVVEGNFLYLLVQHPWIGAQVVFGSGNTYEYQAICYVTR